MFIVQVYCVANAEGTAKWIRHAAATASAAVRDNWDGNNLPVFIISVLSATHLQVWFQVHWGVHIASGLGKHSQGQEKYDTHYCAKYFSELRQTFLRRREPAANVAVVIIVTSVGGARRSRRFNFRMASGPGV